MNSVFRETSELLDIINYNEKILNILKDKNYFENKSEEHNFLKIISGVGFINTIYEKFSRALLNIYCSIKNEKIDKYIKYKSLAKLKEKITLEKYNRSVIEILEIENIVMKILRDTFIERIPNIILETG